MGPVRLQRPIYELLHAIGTKSSQAITIVIVESIAKTCELLTLKLLLTKLTFVSVNM